MVGADWCGLILEYLCGRMLLEILLLAMSVCQLEMLLRWHSVVERRRPVRMGQKEGAQVGAGSRIEGQDSQWVDQFERYLLNLWGVMICKAVQ